MQSGPARTSQLLPTVAAGMQMRGSSAPASGPASGLARQVAPAHCVRSLSQAWPAGASVIDAHCCDDGSHATPCEGSHGEVALHVAPDAPSAAHDPLDDVKPPSPTTVSSLQKKPVAQGAELLHGSPDSPRPAQIDPPSDALVTHVRPMSQGVDPLHTEPSCAAGLFAHSPHAPALDDVTLQNADVHCESSMQAVPPLSDPGVGAHA